MLITIIERGYEPLLQAPTLLRLNPDLNQDAQAALQEFIDQQHFERALSAVETVGQEALDLHGVSGAAPVQTRRDTGTRKAISASTMDLDTLSNVRSNR